MSLQEGWMDSLSVIWVVDALLIVSTRAFMRYLRGNLLTNCLLCYGTVSDIVETRSHPSRSRLIAQTIRLVYGIFAFVPLFLFHSLPQINMQTQHNFLSLFTYRIHN